MDQIHLTGIRAYGYTGVLPEEQTLGQWFEVDLTLTIDLSAAGQSDQLADTFDYRSAISLTQDHIRKGRFTTVERLATVIAEALLNGAASAALVKQVQVRLSKLAAPIPDFGGKITVCLCRSRGV